MQNSNTPRTALKIGRVTVTKGANNKPVYHLPAKMRKSAFAAFKKRYAQKIAAFLAPAAAPVGPIICTIVTRASEAPTKTPIAEALAFLSEKQLLAVKYVLANNFWGDCSQEFKGATHYAYGYITKGNKAQNGKEWSGIWSGIKKAIENNPQPYLAHISDWWQNGSGDVLFVNIDLLDGNEVETWAQTITTTPATK